MCEARDQARAEGLWRAWDDGEGMGELWYAGAEGHDNAAMEKRIMHEGVAIWTRNGATLSDTSARQEFGLAHVDPSDELE